MTREWKQTVNYKPSMQGKKYLFATTVLGRSLLDDDNYNYDPMVAFAFTQQLLLKAVLKQWESEAELARSKEATSQLHWRDKFVPKNYSTLTKDQQKKVLESHMFVVRKRDGLTKARIIAGGNTQQDFLTKEDSSCPTVATNIRRPSLTNPQK